MRSCAAEAGRSLRQHLIVRPAARPHPRPHLCPRPHTTSYASVASRDIKRMVAVESISPVHIAIGVVGLTAVAAWVDALLKSKKPDLVHTATPFNNAVLSRCPTLHSIYQCTPFLTNGHAETILVAKLRKPPGVDYRREIILTKDGGAVAIDWEHHDDAGKDMPADAPVLILFPGLTGGSGDAYVQHAVLQAKHAGIRAAVFNSRGTADSPVITPQFYSASFTEDTREVIAHVSKRYPNSTLFAAGWSLGANILVNYLGEQGSDTPLEAAVSMCNPFDLSISNRHINEGFNQLYNWSLATSLKRIFAKHHLVWRDHPGPAQPARVSTVRTIREFDEAITVHSFKWPDVDAYYAGSSSARRIPKVQIPLLCIQALDDPIAPAEAIPCDEIEANPNCILAVTPCGGHLGWASGPGAPFNEPWSDGAIFEWLSSVHIELMNLKDGSNGTDSGSSKVSGTTWVQEGSTADVAVPQAAAKQSAVALEIRADSRISSAAASSSSPDAAGGQQPYGASAAAPRQRISSRNASRNISTSSSSTPLQPQPMQQHSAELLAQPLADRDRLWSGQQGCLSQGKCRQRLLPQEQQEGLAQVQQEVQQPQQQQLIMLSSANMAFKQPPQLAVINMTAAAAKAVDQAVAPVDCQLQSSAVAVETLQQSITSSEQLQNKQQHRKQQQANDDTMILGYVGASDDAFVRLQIATDHLRWAF